MRIWLIKMLYRSLSPYEQWKAHKYLKQPAIDEVLASQLQQMEENWIRSASYKATQSNVTSPEEKK
jgi:hypothetical protein